MKSKIQKDAATRANHIERRNAAKKRHRATPDIERSNPQKKTRKRFLIYCEGENTEPSYFNQFQSPNIDVRCFGDGHNTLSLLRKAIELRNQAKKNKNPYDEVWCVFDRDPAITNKTGHTAANFNNAISLAKKENIGTAYSNQAFEYWLILHFIDHQGGKMPRTEYNQKLNSYLKKFNCIYDGNGSKMITTAIFDVLESIEKKTGLKRREIAKKRAEKIFNNLSHHNPAGEESCTTVFQLVSKLDQKMANLQQLPA